MKQQDKLTQDAIEIFRKEGFPGLSMGALAKKSGLAKASLFHYFSSKDVLMEKIIEMLTRQLEDMEMALEEKDDASEAFQTYADFHGSDCENGMALLDALGSQYAVMSIENQEKLDAAFETDRHMLAALLHDGRQQGRWRFQLPLTDMAALVQSLVLAAARQGWIDQNKASCDHMVDSALKFIRP